MPYDWTDPARDRPRTRPAKPAESLGRGPAASAGPRRPRRAAVSLAPAPAPGPAPRPAAGAGVPGRRTITIQGRGAERELFLAGYESRRRPSQRPHKRPGFKPDRVAMWAVLLGVLLVLVAAASARAATSFRATTSSRATASSRAATGFHAAAGSHAAPSHSGALRSS